ncbi:MAG: tail fiber domain-containing protein [Candidatus Krumholzibacteriota bacterium]|nr:tail fiber domain-containing protein [Candidatus Krumholzibacteriota bacterium]
MRTAVVIVALSLIIAGTAGAGVPAVVSYQGVLTDAGGAAVPDGGYPVEFRLYDVETGGAPLWMEGQAVTVQKGIFTALLGLAAPLEPWLFEHPLWLGVAVDGEAELAPRVMLTAAAYSMGAASVQDSAVTWAKIARGAVTGEKIADEQVLRALNGLRDEVALVAGDNVTITPSGQEIVIEAAGGGSGIGGSGLAGQVALWDGETSLAGTNELFWDEANGRLGVGSAAPNARLRVESAEALTAVVASTHQADTTQVIRANYLGGGNTDATAVFGLSCPSDGWGFGGKFIGGRTGAYGFANGGGHLARVYGVFGEASGNESCDDYTVGVCGTAYGTCTLGSIGVLGQANGSAIASHFGIYGESLGSGVRYAGYLRATATGPGTRFGLFSQANGGDTNYGVYASAPVQANSYALFADGDIVYSGSVYNDSDARLKEAVAPLDGALDRIMRLEPRSFRFRRDGEAADLHLPTGTRRGFLAQELAEVLPGLVREIVHPVDPESGDGAALRRVLGIDYVQLIPLLVGAVQEQQKEIERLRAEIDALRER